MSIRNSKFLKYKIVHYYWNKSTFEYINIGVICFNENNLKYKIIDPAHIENIRCNFLNKKIFKNTVMYIQDILNSVSNIEELNKKTLYFDNFSFSNEYITKHKNFDDELNSLFEFYVLYKFDFRKKNTAREKVENIKQISYQIIQKEFKNFLEIMPNKNFDLVIKPKNKKQTLSYIYGSLKNTEDVSKALKAEISLYERPYNYIFNFASIYPIENKNKKEAFSKKILEKISYHITDFSSEEKIHNYFENLIKL